MKVTFTPGSSTAFERSSRCKSPIGITEESKYFGSGQTVTRVPDFLSSLPAARDFSFDVTSPPEKASVCTPCPLSSLRQTVISNLTDSAFVTDTPTPCKPPEKAYAPPEPLSNLPPACRRVNTISTVGTFSSGCIPTGIPRPSSSTLTLPSLWSVTMMFFP